MIVLDQEEWRLLELFRLKAADKRMELALKIADQLDEERERHRKIEHRKREKEERELQETIATTAQLATFNEHLNEIDTATVHALMDNRQALDLIFKQRQEMEASAFRLPDGRMAFKTEDGQRVFDQHGTELGSEMVSPDAIPGRAPSWEGYKQKIDAEAKLLTERDQLHDYQRRVDETREAVGKGNVTADALAKMDAGLRQAMPDAVKAQLPGSTTDRDNLQLRALPQGMPERSKAQFYAYAPAGP